MPTSVQTILTAAYQRSTLNDAGKLAQDPELIGHLDRLYQRMWMLIARARPDQYGASTSVTLTGTPAQATLPALIDLVQVQDATGTLVQVIPATERQRLWHLAPAVYRVGQVLRSRMQTGDPINNAVLTLTYLDQPATLALLADTLDPRWPARHAQLLVDALALYLAVKDAGRPSGERQAIAQELAQDVAAFAAEFRVPPSNLGWIHADAERAGATT